MNIKNEEIEALIQFIKKEVVEIFGDNLMGLYLFGSLTYGDFLLERSDVDLLTIIKQKANNTEIEKVQKLFEKIGNNFPTWKGRVECSFTPVYLFSEINPPPEPRPYFGERFYKEAPYGNEWIINNYLIQEHGITLWGKDFKELVPHISITDVKKANKKDLNEEWKTKLNDDNFFQNPHYQSYLILNLCRILYTDKMSAPRSKKVSAEWVKEHYPEWAELIDEAQGWTYKKQINLENESKEFLRFVLRQVNLD